MTLEELERLIRELPPAPPEPDPTHCSNCKVPTKPRGHAIYVGDFRYDRPAAYLCGRCLAALRKICEP